MKWSIDALESILLLRTKYFFYFLLFNTSCHKKEPFVVNAVDGFGKISRRNLVVLNSSIVSQHVMTLRCDTIETRVAIGDLVYMSKCVRVQETRHLMIIGNKTNIVEQISRTSLQPEVDS